MPVLVVEQRRFGVGHNLRPTAGRENEKRSNGRTRNGDSSDGQQPLEYVQPIVNEVQRTTLIDFTEIRQREQEGRDEEEHVHSPGDPAEPYVVEDDQ